MSRFSLFDTSPMAPAKGRVVTEDRTADPVTATADRLWRAWVKATSRPRGPVEPDFVAAVRSEMHKGTAEAIMRGRVEDAAYLPRSGRDKADVKRVIRALGGGADLRRARALARTDGARRQSYDDVALLTPLEDFLQMCDLTLRDVSGREAEIADTLCQRHKPDTLQRKVDRLRDEHPDVILLPSDVQRGRLLTVGWGRKKRGQSVDGYQIGAEDMAADVETMWLDQGAEAMLLRGRPRSEAARLHLQVPDGFWQAALDRVGELGPDGAVAYAESEYGIDLSKRKVEG